MPSRPLTQPRPPRDRGGRPTKYTAPAALRIVLALAHGAERPTAARRAGVAGSTLYEWLKLARAGAPGFEGFTESVRYAEHQGRYERRARRRRRRRERWIQDKMT